MRSLGCRFAWLLCFLFFFGVGAAFQVQESEALQRLGISRSGAMEFIWESLESGRPVYPYKPDLKNLTPAERSGVVRVLGALARDFVDSPAFATQYAEYRESHKPSPPEQPKKADQMRLEQKAAFEKGIREAEANLKSMPAETRAMMQASIDAMKEQVKMLDDPDNPMFGSGMDEALNAGHEAQMEAYRGSLEQWEVEYPADSKTLVRKRLQEFLRESEGVDYVARLKPGPNGKMVFDNPAYEAKSSNWKLCYRAGREPVEAARVLAKAWLAELK